MNLVNYLEALFLTKKIDMKWSVLCTIFPYLFRRFVFYFYFRIDSYPMPFWKVQSISIHITERATFIFVINVIIAISKKNKKETPISLIETQEHYKSYSPQLSEKHWRIFRNVSRRFNVIYLHSWSSHLKRFTPVLCTRTDSHSCTFNVHTNTGFLFFQVWFI